MKKICRSKDYSHSSTSKCSAKSVCLVNTDLLSLEGRRIKTALDVLSHVTRLCRSFLLYVAAGLHVIRNNSNEFSQTGQCWKYNHRKPNPRTNRFWIKIHRKYIYVYGSVWPVSLWHRMQIYLNQIRYLLVQ